MPLLFEGNLFSKALAAVIVMCAVPFVALLFVMAIKGRSAKKCPCYTKASPNFSHIYLKRAIIGSLIFSSIGVFAFLLHNEGIAFAIADVLGAMFFAVFGAAIMRNAHTDVRGIHVWGTAAKIIGSFWITLGGLVGGLIFSILIGFLLLGK